MKIFCDRLKLLRDDASQAHFARQIGLSQVTYSRYEAGTREPDLEVLYRIGKTFSVSIDWLIGLTDETPNALYNPKSSFAEQKLEAVKEGLRAILNKL